MLYLHCSVSLLEKWALSTLQCFSCWKSVMSCGQAGVDFSLLFSEVRKKKKLSCRLILSINQGQKGRTWKTGNSFFPYENLSVKINSKI